MFLGRVRILIKTRLKINFDRFTMKKVSNFIFNRVLISIRTRPYFSFRTLEQILKICKTYLP
jgi:hypothetical protein